MMGQHVGTSVIGGCFLLGHYKEVDFWGSGGILVKFFSGKQAIGLICLGILIATEAWDLGGVSIGSEVIRGE